LVVATAEMERETVDPFQGSNGAMGMVGNPHGLTALTTLHA